MTHRSWVSERFGVQLCGDPAIHDLVSLALRRNPRRAHLLVSRVLGKHVPADPCEVHGIGIELGRRVAKLLDGRSALVLGFAETATALGHCVAEALGAEYLHTTRREVAGGAVGVSFEETHSHATTHLVLPGDAALLTRGEVVVLVDDELSTGRTALNAIRVLHDRHPRSDYVLATLVDLRGDQDRAALTAFAAAKGITIEVASLAAGHVDCPAGFADAAAGVIAAGYPEDGGNESRAGALLTYPPHWPTTVRESGRHGFAPADVRAAHDAAAAIAGEVAPNCGAHVLVLGTEELMYAPTLIALHLAEQLPDVRVSSTTRSPVFTSDVPGYPIRDVLAFDSHDRPADGAGRRFAYNVGTRFTDVVVVVDTDAHTPALHSGLLTQLRARADRVHLVVLPCHRPVPEPLRGPAFGSYSAADVAWLLTDLSDVSLEAPVEEREEAIQSGSAHYAESLPIEFQPDREYQQLFAQALAASALRIAAAVGVVTELVLAERGPAPVLASLARAGTPVGVLLRRWARFAHGIDLPHYAVSIVRDRGIDLQALRYLAQHHDPADVVFVDGWTGKGAIARELTAAIAVANATLGANFRAELAVLADPGCCVTTFGTREDFLIPSACLNSTVSGLVSRTVLNPAVLPAGAYHGAKFYRDLAPDDVSMRFVAAIEARFGDVVDAVQREWPAARRADRTPTWRGWADVEMLAARFGVENLNLVKPGVGETTRVLLRRVPEAVLARADAGPELDHVRLLAAQRGVPVHEVAELAYSCVGIVRTLRS